MTVRLLLYGALGVACCTARAELPPPPTQSANEAHDNRGRARRAEHDALLDKLADAWFDAREPRILVLCGAPRKYVNRHLSRRFGLFRPETSQQLEQKARRDAGNERATGVRGVDRATLTQPGTIASSNLSSRLYIGDDLTLSGGFASKIEAAVVGLLSKREMRIESVQAEAEAQRRLLTVLQNNAEYDAIAATFAETNADYVLYIKLHPEPFADDGTPRVSVELQVHRVGMPGFVDADVLPPSRVGSGKRFLDAYGSRITGWFARAMLRQFQSKRGSLTHVVLVGGQALTRPLYQAVHKNELDGILRIVDRGGSDTQGLHQYDVRHRGDSMQLLFTLQDFAREKLQVELVRQDAIDGALTLGVQPIRDNANRPRRRWETLADLNDTGRAEVMAAVADAYQDRGRPSIAIVINRELTDVEIRAMDAQTQKAAGLDAQAVSGRRMVAYGAALRGFDSGEAQTDAMNTRTMEDVVLRVFREEYVEANIQLRDPTTVAAQIAKQADREQIVFDDAMMMKLIRQANVADLVIYGLGRVDQSRGRPKYSYSFRMVQTDNGEVAAAHSLEWTKREFAASSNPFEHMAREVTARLLVQCMDAWAPPDQIVIDVLNVKSLVQLMRIRDVFDKRIPGVEHCTVSEYTGQSRGSIKITYSAGMDHLLRWFSQEAQSLPFEVASSDQSRSRLSIRILDELHD